MTCGAGRMEEWATLTLPLILHTEKLFKTTTESFNQLVKESQEQRETVRLRDVTATKKRSFFSDQHSTSALQILNLSCFCFVS